MPTPSPFTLNPEDDPTVFKFRKRLSELSKIENQLQTSLTSIYFIWSDKAKSILHDPMTELPVNAKNKALLTEAAKAYNGRIVNGKEARDLLLKHQSQ